jgi:hypothetical protein
VPGRHLTGEIKKLEELSKAHPFLLFKRGGEASGYAVNFRDHQANKI